MLTAAKWLKLYGLVKTFGGDMHSHERLLVVYLFKCYTIITKGGPVIMPQAYANAVLMMFAFKCFICIFIATFNKI